MASSPVEKIINNNLQCGICLQSFENPHELPCHDAFCEECLERWYKTNKKENPTTLVCPTCSKPADIPSDGIKGFPAHLLVNSSQETVDTEEVKEDYYNKVCSKCNTPDKKAKVYCRNCKHFLCESCLDLHKAWESMKQHRVLMVEDLTSGKVTLSDADQQDQYCVDHDDEQKRFYCETCAKSVCRDCIIMKQFCRDHDYVTLKQASVTCVSSLQESIKTCREMKAMCQNALENAKLIKVKLSCNAIGVKEKLDGMTTEYLEEVNARMSSHKSKIDTEYKERNAEIAEETDKLKAAMSQIDSTVEEGVNLTESGSPFDIVSNYTAVLKSLQKVKDIEVKEVDETLAEVEPDFDVGCVYL